MLKIGIGYQEHFWQSLHHGQLCSGAFTPHPDHLQALSVHLHHPQHLFQDVILLEPAASRQNRHFKSECEKSGMTFHRPSSAIWKRATSALLIATMLSYTSSSTSISPSTCLITKYNIEKKNENIDIKQVQTSISNASTRIVHYELPIHVAFMFEIYMNRPKTRERERERER